LPLTASLATAPLFREVLGILFIPSAFLLFCFELTARRAYLFFCAFLMDGLFLPGVLGFLSGSTPSCTAKVGIFFFRPFRPLFFGHLQFSLSCLAPTSACVCAPRPLLIWWLFCGYGPAVGLLVGGVLSSSGSNFSSLFAQVVW